MVKKKVAKKKLTKAGKPRKVRSLQPSKTPKKAAQTVIEKYFDFNEFQSKTMTATLAEKVAADYIAWARTDKALVLKGFAPTLGVTQRTFYRWMEKHEVLKSAHELVLTLIANRREEGGIKGNYNHSIISGQQARYDKDWWELEKKRAELRAASNEKGDSNVVFKIVQEPVEKIDA